MSSNKSNKQKRDKDEALEDSNVFLGYVEDGDKIESEIVTETANCGQSSEFCKPSTSSSNSSNNNSNDESLPPWLVNKIGGLPIFPSNLNINELEQTLEQLICKQCKNKCVLILQMNSPIDDSPFDRVMQVYTCVENNCSKRTWYVIRCMYSNGELKKLNHVESNFVELVEDAIFGQVLICRERAHFEPHYISVMEEPTGRENFAKNNLEALKLAANFTDPDLKPAPIEAKYKNMKNYKPPQPAAGLSDLEDFEKFQLEKLYSNDKVMYRFYKRVSRYQGQIIRYDWEGEPLLNCSKIKISLQPCSTCSSRRKFEFQIMSAIINYLKTENELDFSSILIHSCQKNCSQKTFNFEDTFIMPDPDSRVFNKVKQKMLAVKLNQS